MIVLQKGLTNTALQASQTSRFNDDDMLNEVRKGISSKHQSMQNY